jgi:hypothetical protein
MSQSRYSNNNSLLGSALMGAIEKGVPHDQTKKMDNFMETGIDTKYLIIGGVLIAGFIYFYVYK